MPTIKKTKAEKEGYYYSVSATVANDPNKTVDTIQVYIPEVPGQPIAEPQTYTLQYTLEMNGMRQFRNDQVVFNDNALNFEYEMTFTMYDKYGNVIPLPHTSMVVIEEAMTMV